jgi:hypothetical protein
MVSTAVAIFAKRTLPLGSGKAYVIMLSTEVFKLIVGTVTVTYKRKLTI